MQYVSKKPLGQTACWITDCKVDSTIQIKFVNIKGRFMVRIKYPINLVIEHCWGSEIVKHCLVFFFFKNCYFNSALPKTKEQLQEKNRKLRIELGTVSSQYRENVWRVIENLRRHNDETLYDLMPSYETLKRLIKSSTSNEVLEKCRVPEHEHSVQNNKVSCCNTNGIYFRN